MIQKVAIIAAIILLVASAAISFLYFSSDSNLRPFQDYVKNPDCEFENLGEGYARLSNCQIIKYVGAEDG